MEILVLNEEEIRTCVQMDATSIEAIEEGFSKMVAGEVTLPPILRVDVPENDGEVDVKTAYVHGLDSFAIKIAAGFFGNRRLGLPTGSGMMVLISAQTGRPMAVLLDNGYLTDVRTGIAGAIAAKYLCRKQIRNAGVIGSGMQARYQIRGLRLVRDFQRLYVYGIEPDQVREYADEMGRELGVEVVVAGSAEEVVRGCDFVVTTTPSRTPYLRPEWLHPGLHITCMGADTEHKQEVFAEVFGQVDLIVCDRRSQCFHLGELLHALEAGVLSEKDEIIELGELTSGRHPGRQSDDQITICVLTGVGVQDTMIARLAYERAKARGLGTAFRA